MIPGEIVAAPGELELNKGRNPITIEVANTGDRINGSAPARRRLSFHKSVVSR